MILHFACGANMSRAVMRKHAPGAEPIGVCVARGHRAGRPKASYRELVTAAAREWQLPQAYIASLLRFLPPARRLGDFAWT